MHPQKHLPRHLAQTVPNVLNFAMAHVQSRRNFLRTAPLAAAVALPLTDSLLHAQAPVAGQAPPAEAVAPAPFQLFPAQTIEGMLSSLQATPGAKDIVTAKQLAVSMTISAEEKKIAKEFEFHQHRDHVFQVLDGSTRYELGGTPKNARLIRPGEWLAPESEGAQTITLNKGDMLMVPRMTPHKRSTEGKVSLLLINATTPA
jgi:mannose-6-phosphate isomerase-like protein (cupin superfamily)